ncbi:ABC transporter substrate-binding protein [Frankia sp. CNm7]|uniref:ABC transporter substrate-binding protein n=1 Tax=Frankia nepalensis TaxID=1836974 RepID=A0A937USV8_9ACTN|nr:ABC transporter substrate-binding protein [Frankia nepalensis]MBL7495526.1 ABC transporter substrate-binding protein [Frankia nepalensis]MBL7509807.1 ABC transporter substrate-binding protein [Frankia nepalensis]MBL7518620.1 ABC transporter substrate-binding protein [Frankia nepalensis]MBL7630630.1 ABC transporter substrate-binding protein [Frankia nepalensis]
MSIRARALVAAVALTSLALTACGSRVNSDDQPSNPDGGGTTQASNNTASDTGVSPTEIKVGLISGQTSGLGPDTFSASLYGAQAYFDALNDKGGVNGRKVKLVPCDDKGTGDGNVECAHTLADDEKVFALAGTTAFDYAGAQYLDSQGVPDIGGQPVGDAYYQYPHMFSIYGGFGYPRDGKAPGYDGKLYAPTGNYRWFKEKLNAKTAAVVFLNVPQSQQYASSIALGLQKEGYTVVSEQVDLALRNWDAAVIDMKNKGVEVVFDALTDDFNGQLCEAIQSRQMPLKAKVTTTQSLSDSAATIYAKSPTCLNNLYAISTAKNYNDIDDPLVKQYRDDVAKYTPDRVNKLNQWMFEGYISAKWLTDAMSSCGADLTRECVENYMTTETYDAEGLLIPRDFKVDNPPPTSAKDCLNVVRWTSSAPTGKAGWTSQTDDMTTNCFQVPTFSFDAG